MRMNIKMHKCMKYMNVCDLMAGKIVWMMIIIMPDDVGNAAVVAFAPVPFSPDNDDDENKDYIIIVIVIFIITMTNTKWAAIVLFVCVGL